MHDLAHVAVVGASVTGFSAVRALRAEGYRGRITMIGAETHLPYDRPPLSKQVLAGAWDAHRVTLPGELDAELRLGVEATSVDIDGRVLLLSDDSAVSYDGMVIATGLRPRRLAVGGSPRGVHYLRTIDDCLALRSALLAGPRLAVIGAGFLGAEVAATAAGMGAEVTLIDVLDSPLIRQVGPAVSERLLELHAAHGVRFIGGVTVAGWQAADGRVSGVTLDNGQVVAADTVLVAIGSEPSTGWLAGTGISLSNGIDCDATCFAAPGVVAAGDVANWYDVSSGRRVRLEHRTNAVEHGMAAARSLLGADRPYSPIPYAWTDQHHVRLQVAGHIRSGQELHVVDGDSSGDFLGEYVADGRVQAIIAWNCARKFTVHRRRIGQPAMTTGAEL